MHLFISVSIAFASLLTGTDILPNTKSSLDCANMIFAHVLSILSALFVSLQHLPQQLLTYKLHILVDRLHKQGDAACTVMNVFQCAGHPACENAYGVRIA